MNYGLNTIIGIIFVLLVSGCTTDDVSIDIESLSKSEVNPVNLCNSISDFTGLAGGKSSCLSIMAVETQDTSICEQIPDSDDKSKCLMYIALETMDVQICDYGSIKNPDSCKNSIKIEMAKYHKDDSYCDDVIDCYMVGGISSCSNKKDGCFLGVSTVNPDIDICEKIEKNETKAMCLRNIAIENGDSSLCDDIPWGEYESYGESVTKRICYYQVALKTLDESDCNSLEGEDKLTCIAAVSVGDNNIDQCKGIDNDEIKNTCLYWLAIKNSDSDLCSQSGKELCFIPIAASKNDPNICNRMTRSKVDCINEVSIMNQDPKTCLLNGNIGTREVDICLRETARTVLNPELCNLISSSWFKDWCFTNLIENYYDIEPENRYDINNAYS